MALVNPPRMFDTPVPHPPYIASIADVDCAHALIAEYGDGAGFEASARADRSRDLGNHVHFCRWRQIERLILMLAIDRSIGTVH
ncbi:hypothetical protein [Stakelama saccharophila]|uniref:Uncharacterized protein n=1 Tax=Stakelama saccharophila TaxID=3075605 RepID=A0ABZ0B7S5_9SPHN|nr:hypothetical protein [Stakelama sp. W311]WNO53292.1 hypothetical protein RPR59_12690 [Stakelama sp. W311]